MKRDLNKLAETTYDLLIIGGGIAGACAAWDASLRGLSVALVDKGDFGAATSAASGKLIHGGLRYMQYGSLRRVCESAHERNVFLKIAPHFVHPIPFLIPTYGHFLKGKEILAIGMKLYDFIVRSSTKSIALEKTISPHQVISREKVLEMEPYISKVGLTGGVFIYECLMHNPERLTLSFLLAADEIGADLANYVKVVRFLNRQNLVSGVRAKDILSGDEFDIQAKLVINAAGPWIPTLLAELKGTPKLAGFRFSKGIHVITRSLTQKCALALATSHRHAGALLQRGGRHFFIIPWRNHSLIGTTNAPLNGTPDDKIVTEKDILALLKEINSSYPASCLKHEDVLFFYGGLYPDDIGRSVKDGYQGSRTDQIFDHKRIDGIEGVISVISVKFTTARKLAQKTIDLIFRKLEYEPPECLTKSRSIYGGQIERFDDFLSQEIRKKSPNLDKDITTHLVRNYGSAYDKLLNYNENDSQWSERIHPDLPIIKAQIIHAVRKEMAHKLTDVVFRRTGLGTIGNPGEKAFRICASIMAEELGWGGERVEQELNEVRDIFTPA
jgi:glycerol-3-phosphate dehydrogenase